MPDIPKCKFRFGDVVVVRSAAKYAAAFPETFLVSGIDWHTARTRPVPPDQVNITLLPMSYLEEGGTDGFTPDDLRKADIEEIAQNKRLYI